VSIPGIDFVERPNVGRIFRNETRVRLGDVAPDGRCRLDAVARILQDLSSDDTADAAGSTSDANDGRVWVLRRLALRMQRLPRYREDLRTATWCSGIGPRWAERRSDIEWGDLGRIEAVALWVCTDLSTGAPVALGEDFESVFGVSAGSRRVSARLVLGGPSDDPPTEWPLRATDFDVLGHVNNASYWAPIEESLAHASTSSASSRIELAVIEFRGGVDRGERATIIERLGPQSIEQWWVVDGDVRASTLVALRS
jgi:acyl-ACP thioesterase